MPRIKFHSDQVFETLGPGRGPHFAAGSALDANDVGAVLGKDVEPAYAEGFLDRWVRRGVAAYVDAPAVEAPAAVLDDSTDIEGDDAATTIPDDWRDLSWPAKRKLAASVSDSAIRNGDDADAAIEAFLAR